MPENSHIAYGLLQSAELKIVRAAEIFEEIERVFDSNKFFLLEFGTEFSSKTRTLRRIQNLYTLKRVAILGGDMMHNLRCALDHLYWGMIDPYVTAGFNKKNIKFPIFETQKIFLEHLKQENLLPERIVEALKALQPYKDNNGNERLYKPHELDIIDKHNHLIPISAYSGLSIDSILRQIPDFPHRGFKENKVFMTGGYNYNTEEFSWECVQDSALQPVIFDCNGIAIRYIDIEFRAVFPVGEFGNKLQYKQQLGLLLAETRKTVSGLTIVALQQP